MIVPRFAPLLALAALAALPTLPGAVALDPALPEYRAAAKVSGEIVAWGEPPFEGLVTRWRDAFRRHHPDVAFRHFLKGSGTAGGALYTGAANVGLFGRELHAAEVVTWRRIFAYDPLGFSVAGGSFATFPETVAPAILVNAANPLARISFAQLDALYSHDRLRGAPARIAKWGELGLTGEWADRPITLYGLDPETGTAQYLRERVLLNGRWQLDAQLPPSAPKNRYAGSGRDASAALVTALENDRYAIGLAGFRNLTPRLKALAVSEADAGPFVAGSPATVLDRSYPLSRLVYLFVNKAPGQPWDPKLREFLRFVLSRDGQACIVDAGIYLPLPESVVRGQLKKLE